MKVGIIGARGMVGAVLMRRLIEENDLLGHEVSFFSTSQMEKPAPALNGESSLYKNAYDLEELYPMDVLLVCQGSDYTKRIQPCLRQSGWKGFWIDAASALRMHPESLIVLDPLNDQNIRKYIKEGGRDLVGGNCTVSLLLMALAGLLKDNDIEWISTMTYQAISGAGAKAMKELISQMAYIGEGFKDIQDQDILDVDQLLNFRLSDSDFPQQAVGRPIACNALPWIDSPLPNGKTREEGKAFDEANKILGNNETLPIDGFCVRVPTMRCHSQAVTLKLKSEMSLDQVKEKLQNSHKWLQFVENDQEETLGNLTPVAVSGSLNIAVGRLRELKLGPENNRYIGLYTVGDQLLWGAAEPLRRAFKIAQEELS